MHHSSTLTQDSTPSFHFVPQFSRFAFNSGLLNDNPDCYSSSKSNLLYYDTFKSSIGLKQKRKAVSASLILGCKASGSSSIGRIVNEFNRVIKFHCERIPIGFGFASVRVGSSENNGFKDENGGVLEGEGLPLNAVENESPKKVLILMSDTGGGHRASAEAIKAAFNEKFGDEYQVRLN